MVNEQFEQALLEESTLTNAISIVQDFPNEIDFKHNQTKFQLVFDAIERRTAEATLQEQQQDDLQDQISDYNQNVNTQRVVSSSKRTAAQFPVSGIARMEMTQLYTALRESQQLQVFGAASHVPPAAGSHTVTPMLLEQVTNLSMNALTPQSSTNSLLVAGILLAVAEGFVANTMHWDYNALVFGTLLLTVLDRFVTNGAIMESIMKILSPGIQSKIIKHEAGHFLTAYLLGLPVEGYVLSAWAAKDDVRFNKRNANGPTATTSVSAGTSFFDPILSNEMNVLQQVSRSSMDRYSIVVMAGIAAEALHYGRADGGAGDEMALVTLLSQIGWKTDAIRNQARWGVLQAILLLKEYQPAYQALVNAMEHGATLGECIYAIESTVSSSTMTTKPTEDTSETGNHQMAKLDDTTTVTTTTTTTTTALKESLLPMKEPIGYILDEGPYGIWTKKPPLKQQRLSLTTTTAEPEQLSSSSFKDKTETKSEVSLQTLSDFRSQVEARLQDIDARLKQLDSQKE